MRTYLITYDLATPARHTPVQRHHAARRRLGPPARDHLVRAIAPSARARSSERLKPHLDGEDGLLIQQVETDALLLNTALRWFRKRRLEEAGRDRKCRCVPVASVA